MEYRETLPDGCPRDTAQDIKVTTLRYRLVEKKVPLQKDFDSFFKTNGRYVKNSDRPHCDQNGVSLYARIEAATMLFKGPKNKNGRRWQSIGKVTLISGAGKLAPIEQDGHQTWWPTKDFDPVDNCEILS